MAATTSQGPFTILLEPLIASSVWGNTEKQNKAQTKNNLNMQMQPAQNVTNVFISEQICNTILFETILTPVIEYLLWTTEQIQKSDSRPSGQPLLVCLLEKGTK